MPKPIELPPLDESYKLVQQYAISLSSGVQYSITVLSAEVKCRERQLLETLNRIAEREKEIEAQDVVQTMLARKLAVRDAQIAAMQIALHRATENEKRLLEEVKEARELLLNAQLSLDHPDMENEAWEEGTEAWLSRNPAPKEAKDEG